MDLYTLYRKPNQEKLKTYEEEYLEKIADQYAYFTLPHYLKARNAPSKENIFAASAYSVNRKLLKKYLEGKLFFTDLPPEKTEKEEIKPEPRPIMQSEPHYKKPLHQLFSIIDFTQASGQSHAPNGLLSIADGVLDQTWVVPFLSWDIDTKVIKHQGLAAKIHQALYRFQESDFPEVEKTEPVSPPAQEEALELEPQQETKKSKSQSLIDQFLASPSSIKRKRIPPSEPEAPSIVTESITEDEDLVTETLARLHLLQNNPEEAIRIYQKLRLLFPEKNAYFDAQINKIKET